MVTPKTKSGYQVKSIDWKLHIDGQNLEKLSSVGVRAEVCILIEASFCRWRLSASLLYCRCLQLALRLRRWRGGKNYWYAQTLVGNLRVIVSFAPLVMHDFGVLLLSFGKKTVKAYDLEESTNQVIHQVHSVRYQTPSIPHLSR